MGELVLFTTGKIILSLILWQNRQDERMRMCLMSVGDKVCGRLMVGKGWQVWCRDNRAKRTKEPPRKGARPESAHSRATLKSAYGLMEKLQVFSVAT